jgi:hypothetical protein
LSLLAVTLASCLFAQRAIPVENEFVRVVSVVDQHAAKPGAVHEHKDNRVMIYLDPADINIRYTDPKAGGHKDEDQRWKAGDVAWSPSGGLHTSQHVSEKPSRIVEIELRKPAPAKAAAQPPSGTFILDNPQVRVYRASTPPPGGNYVAVNMSTAAVTWNSLPSGPGPFVITLLK